MLRLGKGDTAVHVDPPSSIGSYLSEHLVCRRLPSLLEQVNVAS